MRWEAEWEERARVVRSGRGGIRGGAGGGGNGTTEDSGRIGRWLEAAAAVKDNR